MTPEDLLNFIPFIRDLPRTFLMGDGFKMKLSGQELQIDHMGYHSTSPANKRNCMVGFSYSTPVAFFGSRIDIPLLHADTPQWSAWAMSSPGDYVVHLMKDSTVQHPTMGLMARARF